MSANVEAEHTEVKEIGPKPIHDLYRVKIKWERAAPLVEK